MKFLKQFFFNSSVLVISAIISIISFLLYSIYIFIYVKYDAIYLFSGFAFIFMAILILALLISYIKGDSSCQKTLIGSILAVLTLIQMYVLSSCIALDIFSISYEIIMTIATYIIFSNHLLLQKDNVNNKFIIKFNFVVIVVICIMRIYEFIANILQEGIIPIYNLLWSIEFTSIIIMIICIETRVAKYKMVRYQHLQNGTWTQEEKEKQKMIFKLF